MLANEVRQWFKNGCHFGTGMTLLARTGANPSAFANLNKFMVVGGYVPDTAKKRLQHELREWIKGQPVKPMSENATIVQNPDIPQPATRNSQPEEPAPIKALRQQAIPWHKKRSMLHEALRHAKTDSERYEIAKEIMEVVTPKLDGIYAQIRRWEKEGVLPEAPGRKDIINEVKAMFRREKTLRSRISRLKSWLKNTKLEPVKRQKYEQELLDKEVELAKLEQELKL